jgi:hypothetical protein
MTETPKKSVVFHPTSFYTKMLSFIQRMIRLCQSLVSDTILRFGQLRAQKRVGLTCKHFRLFYSCCCTQFDVVDIIFKITYYVVLPLSGRYTGYVQIQVLLLLLLPY